MSALAQAPRPRLFWCSGGDVMMRLDGCAIRLDSDQQADLLSLFDDERKAALENPRGPATDAWIAAMQKHNELESARIEAHRWARAAGQIRRAA